MEVSSGVPVVHRFNDAPGHMRGIARFGGSLPRWERIDLVPCHRLGWGEDEGLGREYLMPDILPPTAGNMEQLKRVVEESCSLRCQIGG